MKQIDKVFYKRLGYQVRSTKQQIKRYVRDLMLARMVYDNIKEFIMPGFDIEFEYDRITLRAHKKTTVQGFFKQVDLLARKLNKEPNKSADKYDVRAWFWLFDTSVGLRVTTENTEKCDIITRQETRVEEITEVTGYCKELLNKKHLQIN